MSSAKAWLAKAAEAAMSAVAMMRFMGCLEMSVERSGIEGGMFCRQGDGI
jgi:hypothetical protein